MNTEQIKLVQDSFEQVKPIYPHSRESRPTNSQRCCISEEGLRVAKYISA